MQSDLKSRLNNVLKFGKSSIFQNYLFYLTIMVIIAKAVLRELGMKYSDAKEALAKWYFETKLVIGLALQMLKKLLILLILLEMALMFLTLKETNSD